MAKPEDETTTTTAPTTTTTAPIEVDENHHDNHHQHGDENLDGEYLNDCIREEVIEIMKPNRIEVFTPCNMLYSLDVSKMPIVQAYQSDAYDKPHVLIVEFDNGKQLKFYTNIRNHAHRQIKHIFLKNEVFQKLVKDLGLNYTVDI
jgi:hypothetical protein